MKMNAKLKHLPIAAFAALALTLAGCGGGGGSDPVVTSSTPTMMPAPEPAPTPAEQLAAANEAFTTAQAAVAALTSSSTPEEAAAAYGALGEAQTAVHAATNLPDNQIAALQSQVDTLTTQLNTANTVIMQAASVKEALAAATTAVDGITDESDDAAVAAARTAVGDAQAALTAAAALPQDASDDLGALISSLNARLVGIETARAEPGPDPAATEAAKTKTTAIEAEAGQTDDAGLGGSIASDITAGDEGSYALSIERDRMATTVTVTVNGATDDDDVKFMQAMDLGGGRTMHVRTMDVNDDGEVVQEVVVVKTDIEAPKATAFAMVAGQALNVHTDTTNDDPTETFEALTVDTANSALIMSAAFTAGTAAVLTFDSDVTGTTTEDEAFETSGTYNGAVGTYRCNGNADCTVNINAMGAVSGVGNGWIFTPDAGATSDVPDADYLHYGFWLERTTDEDGVRTYNEVETFAGSSVAEAGALLLLQAARPTTAAPRACT